MDEHFTNTAETVYLASLTQAKKILFLERELFNNEQYTKNLEQNLQATKLTLNRLVKERTNNEVLAKMSENLYRMERKHREVQELLKENNAKLLIQMQLRLQEKAEYCDKIKQLEEQIEWIRKTNKDKEQEFTIVVNKLRKYEDIRELILEDKMGKDREGRDIKKMLIMKQDDKDSLIRQLAQELNHYKGNMRDLNADLDRKLATLSFAMENQVKFALLKQQYKQSIANPTHDHNKKKKVQQIVDSKQDKTKDKEGINEHVKLNQSTRQLVKQLKKLVISNRILESALNQSTEKNEELYLINQVLIEANLQLRSELAECSNRESSLSSLTKKNQAAGETILARMSRQAKGKKSETQNNGGIRNSSQVWQGLGQQRGEAKDDGVMRAARQMDIPQLVRERRLKQYISKIKSKDYDINVQSLLKDVHRMGQFLILSLGSRSKQLTLQAKQTMNYLEIINKQQKKKLKGNRSISLDCKAEDQVKDQLQSQRKTKDPQYNTQRKIKTMNPNLQIQPILVDDDNHLKVEDEEIYIQEY